MQSPRTEFVAARVAYPPSRPGTAQAQHTAGGRFRCSPFGSRHRWRCVCVAALLLLAACDQSQPASPASARPLALAPVGPIPGGGEPRAVPNPYANDDAALVEGRRLFVAFNCYGCHGGHGGGGMGPSLRDADWIYGGTEADIFDSIASGRAHGMPAWGVMLPSDQIWKMTAYIASLRTPREPDPPQ